MKTSDEILTELSDREAIRDLPVRYCDCVWQGTLEAMLDLFAKDAVFITKGRQREAVSRGRDELRKMYQKALGDFTPRPVYPQSRGRSQGQDQRDRPMLRRTAQRVASDGVDRNRLLRR